MKNTGPNKKTGFKAGFLFLRNVSLVVSENERKAIAATSDHHHLGVG